MDALTLIDEEIRRLKELRIMAQDPRMLELMRMVSNAGNVPVPSTPKPQPGHLSFRATGLTEGVSNAVRELEGLFTIREVKAHLDSKGVRIGAAKPMIAISGILQRMVEKGVIDVVQKGKAGMPSQYCLSTLESSPSFPMSA